MPISAKYAHTNLVARDWRVVAKFYEEVFGCVRLLPERNFSGADLERGTGVSGARLTGAHLLLPGCGENGPTLEIFNYNTLAEGPIPAVNRPGFGHIAFVVDDVSAAVECVVKNGGGRVGEIVTLDVAGPRVTWCYVTDPEENVIELQSWSN